MKLQQKFDKWILDNNLESNIKFDDEQSKAYDKNNAIAIIKDDKKLVLMNINNSLNVSLHQSLENAKRNIDTISFNKLLNGETVSKITQTYGVISKIEENSITLKNPNGEFNIPIDIKNLKFKEGDKIEAVLKINTVDLNNQQINLDQYDIKEAGEAAEHKTIIYELDKENLTIVENNPQALLDAIKSINSIELTKEQKNKLLNGEEVDLDNDLKVKLSPINIFKANQKNILIASVLLDGGLTFMLLKAIDYLKEKQSKENIKDIEKLILNTKEDLPEEIKVELNKEVQKEKIRDTDSEELTLVLNGDKQLVSQDDILNVVKDKIKNENLDELNLKVMNHNKAELINIDLNKKDLILKNPVVFNDYLNTKNQVLFNNKNEERTREQLSEKVEISNALLINSKLSDKDKINTQNNFESYLNSIKSVLLQKSRAYPENKDIIRDINIISKNISLISPVGKQNAQQHKKASAIGTNDPDMLQRAREQKEQKIKEIDKIFHPKNQASKGRRL